MNRLRPNSVYSIISSIAIIAKIVQKGGICVTSFWAFSVFSFNPVSRLCIHLVCAKKAGYVVSFWTARYEIILYCFVCVQQTVATVVAHNNQLACIALNSSGKILATASVKVVRVLKSLMLSYSSLCPIHEWIILTVLSTIHTDIWRIFFRILLLFFCQTFSCCVMCSI